MEDHRAPLRLLLVITDAEAALAVSDLLKRMHIPLQYQCRGQGTASSEILSLCGLGETTKALSLSLIPQAASAGLLKGLGRELQLKRRGAGIAVTIPINGLQSSVLHLLGPQMRIAEKIEAEKEGSAMTEQATTRDSATR